MLPFPADDFNQLTLVLIAELVFGTLIMISTVDGFFLANFINFVYFRLRFGFNYSFFLLLVITSLLGIKGQQNSLAITSVELTGFGIATLVVGYTIEWMR